MENDTNLSVPSAEELQMLIAKSNSIPSDSLLNAGSYCDFYYENEWHAAFIKEVLADKLELEFFFNQKMKTVTAPKSPKVSLFRFHSNQFKNISIRDYTYDEKELNEIKDTLIKAESQLFDLCVGPYDLLQFLTGKIPEVLDVLALPSDNSDLCALIFDILLLVLKLITNCIAFANNHRTMLVVVLKNRELSLLDKAYAYLLSIEALGQCQRRIISIEYKKSIYMKVSNSIDDKRKEWSITSICAEPDHIDKKSFCFLIDVLAHWGMIRSTFELIIESPQILLDLIDKLIFSFKIFKMFVNSEAYSESVSKLIAYYQQRICALTENELKELKKNAIIDYTKAVLVLGFQGDVVRAESEKMFYLFLHRCFLSQNLEKRIYAVNAINVIVSNITLKPNNEEEKITFSSYELLIDFVKAKNIISILLGENAHDELIKRSIGVFRFLAEKDQLSKESYESLWENYTKRHESVSMQIENVICEIASVVNEERLMLLFEKIKTYRAINVKILHFIRKFTQGCFRTNKAIHLEQGDDFFNCSHLFGLPLLWKYFQDSYQSVDPLTGQPTIVQNNESNVKECVESIHALLMLSSISESVALKVLSLCAENIGNHLSVIQSLRLIKTVCRDWKNQRLFQAFSNSIDVIELVITDLERYLNTSGNDMDITYEGFYDHEKNIKLRIKLILFLDEVSHFFSLTPDHILALWNIFCSKERSINEQYILFNCLQSHISLFNTETLDFLFNEILNNEARFNCSLISNNALTLFENVFLEVNKTARTLFFDGKHYRVKSSKIEGIDTLWQILVLNANSYVQERVCRLLSDLCVRLFDYTSSFSLGYWSGFIEKLTGSLQEANEANNSVGINGLISLTRKVYCEVDYPGIIPQKEDIVFVKNNYELFVFVCPLRKNKQYHVKVGKDENLFDVRWRMAYYYDIEVNKLVFKYKNRSANMLNDFIRFTRLFDSKDVVQVTAEEHPLLALNNPKRLIEGKEEILKILFSLLHHSDEEYIAKAWELIRSLPEKNYIQKQIKSLGQPNSGDEVDFSHLIDLNSLYVVTYSLLLINKYITSTEWLMNFILNKGNDMVMKIFLNLDIAHFLKKGETIILDCLNEVIPLLRATLSNSELNQSDKDSIIKKIIQLLSAIVKVSIEADKSSPPIDYDCIDRVQREFLEEKEDDDDSEANSNSNEGNHLWKTQSTVIRNLLEFIEGTGIEADFKREFFGTNSLNDSKVFKELYTFNFINLVNPFIKKELYLFITNVFDEDSSKDKKHFNIKKVFFESIFTIDSLIFAKQNDLTGFYFNMLSIILTKYIDVSLIHIDLKELCDLNLIASFQNDQQVEGYMKLLHTLLLKVPGLLKYVVEQYDSFEILLKKGILSKCENEPLTKPFPRCSSQRSQFSVYMVMGALCAYSPQLTEKVMKILNDYHHLGFWKTKHFTNWRLSLTNDRKGHYVGLKNLGCTCYMNSLLQMLFMIPRLRETILSIDYQYPDDKYKNSVYQLKNIFASLKAYESQFYNAKDFCSNFDGESLDIREQMDAEEFYSRLIDKLENRLKDMDDYKNVFKYFFGVKTVDELIFKECIHKRENEWYYNSIQLQVACKKNIMESLDSYIQGETMEGNNAIYCEKCEKKMPALKRQTFRVFPRKLVLVLKRFEFDYDNMVKVKLNNYFEFPMVLNMAPYAQVPQEKEINYNLTGVIIHVGTSESGHYYSLLTDGAKWYEFNDTSIKEFDISEIGNEAFGGYEDVYNRDNKKETVEKTMNAYILLYSKSDCDSTEENFPCKIEENTVTAFSNIPVDIMDRINNDMLQYWVLKNISSNQYQKFIKELLKQASFFSDKSFFICRNSNFGLCADFTSRLPMRSIEAMTHNIRARDKIEVASNEDVVIGHEANLFVFGCLFFFNVVIRCKEVFHQAEFADIIKAYINDSVDNAKWLIEEFSNKEALKEFIVECPFSQCKKLSVGMIYCALCKIAQSQSSSNDMKVVSTFINSLLQMTLVPNDMDFIWMLLHRVFMLFKELSLTIFASIDFTDFCWEYFLISKKKNLNVALSSELNANTLPITHRLLSDPSSFRIERLTSSEESIEKKNNERLFSNRNDRYLLNTMLFLLDVSDITKEKLIELLGHLKAKSSAIFFSNAMMDFSKSDNAKAKVVLEALLIFIRNNDANLLEWPLLVTRRFLFKDKYHQDDVQGSQRIAFFFKQLHTIIVHECLSVYTFIECMTDFLIKCHTNYKERLQIAKNDIDAIASCIYGFFNENKYPPKYVPNQKVRMFKEDYTCPRNVSSSQLKTFEENFDLKRKDYQNGVYHIYKSKSKPFNALDEVIERQSNFDSDEELTDYKFCVNDKVLYDGYNCRVIGVLDEIIQIEYSKEEIEGKKRPRTEWIETDSKTLVIKELCPKPLWKSKENAMQVDKASM